MRRDHAYLAGAVLLWLSPAIFYAAVAGDDSPRRPDRPPEVAIGAVTSSGHYRPDGSFTEAAIPAVAFRYYGPDGKLHALAPPEAVERERRAAAAQPPALVGDGKADDTAALQRLIDDAPAGACVRIPAGRYRTTKPLVIGKTFSIVGDGAYAQALGPFGNADYGTGAVEWGTVSAYEGRDGPALDHMPGKYTGLRVEALVLAGVGDASRTSTGLRASFRGGAVTLSVRDVHLSNFKVGLDLDSVENSHLDSLRLNGCDIGVLCRLNTNANVLTNVNTSSCGDGLVFQGAAKNVVIGGAIQASVRNGVIIRATSEENSLRDIYFENKDARYAIDVEAGCDATTIDACHFGTTGDAVRIAAYCCRVLSAKYSSAPLTISGGGGQVVGPWLGTSPALSATTTHLGDQSWGITSGGPVRWPGSGSLDNPSPGALRWRSAAGKSTTLARP